MGRRYYCDFCDKSFVDTPQVVRKHINGSIHQNMKKSHYAKFRDKRTVLAEESLKNPCNRFHSTGHCPFELTCRYSHYTREQLEAIAFEVNQENQSTTSRDAITANEFPNFTSWFTSRRKRCLKDSAALVEAFMGVLPSDAKLTELISWNYPEQLNRIYNIPPSVRMLTLRDFQNVSKLKEWG